MQASTAALVLLMTLTASALHSSIPHPAYASVQPVIKSGGLLSTEAGTLARVIADATITAAGYLGTDLLLNFTLLPPLVICIVSIAATLYTYNTLYWRGMFIPLQLYNIDPC